MAASSWMTYHSTTFNQCNCLPVPSCWGSSAPLFCSLGERPKDWLKDSGCTRLETLSLEWQLEPAQTPILASCDLIDLRSFKSVCIQEQFFLLAPLHCRLEVSLWEETSLLHRLASAFSRLEPLGQVSHRPC